MRLDYTEDDDGTQHFYLMIPASDLMQTPMSKADRIFIGECEALGNISDKLEGLAFIARRIEACA